MKITRFGHAVIEGDTHLGKWVEQLGTIDHGQNIEQRFREYFGEGDTVIDVGACIGDHTVPYAQIVGPEGRVIAFEPNPIAWECLVHNTQCYPWIEKYRYGLAERVDVLGIIPQANLGATFLTELTPDSGAAISTCPLDGFDIQECAFIKIDVEGLELGVLKGARETLRRCRPVIMMEVIEHHQKRAGFSANHLFVWLQNNLEDYVIDPPCHDGRAQYDLVATPKERLTVT